MYEFRRRRRTHKDQVLMVLVMFRLCLYLSRTWAQHIFYDHYPKFDFTLIHVCMPVLFWRNNVNVCPHPCIGAWLTKMLSVKFFNNTRPHGHHIIFFPLYLSTSHSHAFSSPLSPCLSAFLSHFTARCTRCVYAVGNTDNAFFSLVHTCTYVCMYLCNHS